jgi:hypothetical protein
MTPLIAAKRIQEFQGFIAMISSALTIGEVAPEFDAVSFDGKKISLSQLRQQGPVFLVFLRGFG